MNLNVKLILLFLLALSILPANAKTFKNEFVFHIIKPKFRIKWDSPQKLAISSAKNSLRKRNYSPIGHFAVEINCESPNEYGINHVLTGMETAEKGQSQKVTMKKRLGLGSVFYNFPGDLQNAKDNLKALKKAKKDNRLTTVTIPTSASRCQKGLEFLDKWINAGSYTVYGGMKDVQAGEGSGCADFALEFFSIATSIAARDDIFAKVFVPFELIGDGEDKRVSFFKILFTRNWAKDATEGKLYITPDTNKVVDFIIKDTMAVKKEYVYIRHLGLTGGDTLLPGNDLNRISEFKHVVENKAEALKPYEIEEYDFKFEYAKRESSQETWSRISIEGP